MAETLAMALHILNVALILVLLFIYMQNYRKIRMKFTAGLLLFAAFFLIQSIMNLYFDMMMVMYSSKSAELASMVLEIVKAAGFGILVWISWE